MSAYLIRPDHFRPLEKARHQEPGGRAVSSATGKNFYREIAIDTWPTIVNDLIPFGRPPDLVCHARGCRVIRAGSPTRRGGRRWWTVWAASCHRAGAVWCGAASTDAQGTVMPPPPIVRAARHRQTRAESQRITGDVRDGDAIIFLPHGGRPTASALPAHSDSCPRACAPIGHGAGPPMARRCSRRRHYVDSWSSASSRRCKPTLGAFDRSRRAQAMRPRKAFRPTRSPGPRAPGAVQILDGAARSTREA